MGTLIRTVGDLLGEMSPKLTPPPIRSFRGQKKYMSPKKLIYALPKMIFLMNHWSFLEFENERIKPFWTKMPSIL